MCVDCLRPDYTLRFRQLKLESRICHCFFYPFVVAVVCALSLHHHRLRPRALSRPQHLALPLSWCLVSSSRPPARALFRPWAQLFIVGVERSATKVAIRTQLRGALYLGTFPYLVPTALFACKERLPGRCRCRCRCRCRRGELTLVREDPHAAGRLFQSGADAFWGAQRRGCSVVPPCDALLFHTKSQTLNFSSNAGNIAISLKIGTYIEVAIENLCYNF